jgi:hypothetical protein
MKYLREYIDFSEIEDIHYDGCSDYPDFEGHEDFCKFLIDRGVIDKYIIKFYKWSGNEHNSIKKFLDTSEPSNYLYMAFIFNEYGEEYDWFKLNREWIKTISK